MKYIFIIHPDEDDGRVDALAEELELRGVPCLADHRGGLAFSAYVPEDAPRLIEEDSCGCLIYASGRADSTVGLPPVFASDFICRLEVPAARRALDRGNGFMLAAIPHDLTFEQLGDLSVSSFGMNLAHYQTAAISGEPAGSQHQVIAVASEVLNRLLEQGPARPLQISFNTCRTELPRADDVLSIDWSHVLGNCKSPTPDACSRLMAALRDVEAAIARVNRRGAIRVRGDFHLSAGIALGHTFSRYQLEIEVSTGDSLWTSDGCQADLPPLRIDRRSCDANSSALHCAISLTDKDTRPAVERYEAEAGLPPLCQLLIEPTGGRSATSVRDAETCRTMVSQIRQSIADVLSYCRGTVDQIHIFLAGPKQLAVMLGHELSALPPVQLYEYDGLTYHPSFRLTHAGGG